MIRPFLPGCACYVALALCGVAVAEAPSVGLLNLDRIFKDYKPFREKQTQLQEVAKEVDQKVQARQAELETVNNQLRKTVQGSAEFTRLQIQLFKLQNDLQQFVNSERVSIQKQEATMLLALHRQLDELVSKHAKAKGIKLVLRYHDVSFDENQPVPEIAKTVNRQILYEDGLDITDAILKELQAAPASGDGR